ncbi:MAG: hypothetical protein JNL76_05855 [Alphaproteobacteria bacterium]|nr:hypothetical protein [Alphaproteobacteria bacterium]
MKDQKRAEQKVAQGNHVIFSEKKDVIQVSELDTPNIFKALNGQKGGVFFRLIGIGNYGENNYQICLRLLRIIEKEPSVSSKKENKKAKTFELGPNSPGEHIMHEIVLQKELTQEACQAVLDGYNGKFYTSQEFYNCLDQMIGEYPALFDHPKVVRRVWPIKEEAYLVLSREDGCVLCKTRGDGLVLPTLPRFLCGGVQGELSAQFGCAVESIKIHPSSFDPKLRTDFIGVSGVFLGTPQLQEEGVWVPARSLMDRLKDLYGGLAGDILGKHNRSPR